MECLVLHISTFIPQKVHCEFQVLLRINVRSHDIVICPVQENFSEKFHRLPLGYIIWRYEQCIVFCKEPLIVCRQKLRHQGLMPRQEVLNAPVSAVLFSPSCRADLKCSECITGDVETPSLHVFKEIPKLRVLKHPPGQLLLFDSFSQH